MAEGAGPADRGGGEAGEALCRQGALPHILRCRRRGPQGARAGAGGHHGDQCRGDRREGRPGWIAYKSSVPLVAQIGAQTDIMMPKPKEFLADLKKRGIYTIARIVTFKDTPLSTSRPDLAVQNASTGRPWVDNEGLTWTDATRPEVWDYNIALAVEAIELGFDEVPVSYTHLTLPTNREV